ncbi:MAG: Rho GTPase activation protein [Benjaminiella poitrasii]|nr:MAG: Rho GTPase activation protein [Benjaminiella poitrasii]
MYICLIRLTKDDQQPNKRPNTKQHYWETIESYYVKRLNALQKDIETATQQNSKLSSARDEMVQEILKLHQRSIELSKKNDMLSQSIAEKETQISAFMYRQHTPVTLVDNPSEVAVTSSSSLEDEQNIPTTPKPTTHKKDPHQPGLFRQISLRLSSRRKRPQEESRAINQSSQLENNNASELSTHYEKNENQQEQVQQLQLQLQQQIQQIQQQQQAIFHPAVVISSSQIEQNHHNYIAPIKNCLVFGNDLVLQAKSENSIIPSIVLRCIREVESRGMSVEGIYRKSGTFGQIRELQELFNLRKDPQLSSYQDINVITSLLKLYFRALPAPIISNDFILSPSLNDQERLNRTYVLLHNLPIEAYCTIKYLVQHLKRVHQMQHVNRMPSKNLAIVFGPTLMRFTTTLADDERQMHDMIQTIEFIILQSHILFADYS